LAAQAAVILKQRKQTIMVAESSSGGLISAALLVVPGASAYFIAGAVLYTRKAHELMLDLAPDAFPGMRVATEAHSLAVARHTREQFGATWCLTEHGAAGPTGNRYGDAAGHSAIALAGPVERTMTLETGNSDRPANMQAFSKAALEFLLKALAE
jgi:PncC family amidohydrolase